MDVRDLYEEVILDHNRNPRNFGARPQDANASADGHNPLCGDQVRVHLSVKDGVITAATFEGEGCAISTASASLMTEAVVGRSVEDAHALFARLHEMLTASDAPDANGDIGKLWVLAGVREFPMRVKCATLPWHTLEAALHGDETPVSTEVAEP